MTWGELAMKLAHKYDKRFCRTKWHCLGSNGQYYELHVKKHGFLVLKESDQIKYGITWNSRIYEPHFAHTSNWMNEDMFDC